MILKGLIIAINGLSSALHDLASSNRALAGVIEAPRYDPEAIFQAQKEQYLRERIEKWIERDKGIEELAGIPLGKVYYSNPDTRDREKEAIEMMEYLQSRGFPTQVPTLEPLLPPQEPQDARG